MNDNNEHSEHSVIEEKTSYIRMKKFRFVMLIFTIILVTAGITTFALAFGDDKAVVVPNERHEFSKLYEAYDILDQQYFKDIDKEKLVNGAIDGMLQSLEDPYSDYMTVEESSSFHESISSSFEGIGAEIQEQEGYITIVSPIKGSPAEKSGLKPNDKIVIVDGKSIQGMSANEAVLLIRGEKGSKVDLTIQRPGVEEPMDISIIRDTIPLQTVYSEMLEEGVAKVQITSFSENTTEELVKSLNELKSQGMTSLVLDLRQNPGGLLQQAVSISSLFVPNGEVLFQVEDRNGDVQKYTSENKENLNVPLVVIIDKGSASASEILAAAVKESANIPLIGEKSFGKGTVQTAQDFQDGSNLKFTTAKWLTPKGNWIHKKGIKPDYEVTLPDYAYLPFLNPEKELKLHTASTDVQTAQKMLKAVGYDPGRDDGYFDEQTEKVVKTFQKASKLEETGILTGKSTLELMNQLRLKITKEDPQILKAIEILKGKK